MNRRSAKLSTNYYRSKFILRPDWSAKFILRPDRSAKFILRPDWSAKFILRFDFLDITVLYSIGKRYNNKTGQVVRCFFLSSIYR